MYQFLRLIILLLNDGDLVNSVYLTDLVAGVTSYQNVDMLVLSDGTIIIERVRGSFDVILYHYAADGTLINSFSQGPGFITSMAYDFTDPENYVLLRMQDRTVPELGVSVIKRIKIADGTSTETKYVRYEDGQYTPPKTLTPLAKFGISQSCPFFPFVLQTVAGGIYKLTPNSSQYTPRRNDKLWLDVEAQTTEEVKIPDPFIESAAIGD